MATLEINYPFMFKVEVGTAISSNLIAFIAILKSEISVWLWLCAISDLVLIILSIYDLVAASWFNNGSLML